MNCMSSLKAHKSSSIEIPLSSKNPLSSGFKNLLSRYAIADFSPYALVALQLQHEYN